MCVSQSRDCGCFDDGMNSARIWVQVFHLSSCLIYLSISANQPSRLTRVTAWLTEVPKSMLFFANCRGDGLRLHNTVVFRLSVVKGTYWLRTFLRTYSMEQSPSWEANRFSVKKFPAFYGTRSFITAFTSARHLSLSWASSIQSIPARPTCWRSIFILSSHLRLGLLSARFP